MPQFRWPELHHDHSLAREVASTRPSKSADWDKIAGTLSALFSTEDKPVELKGRGCRERLERLLDKFKSDDAKSLKRLAEIIFIAILVSLSMINNYLGPEQRRITLNLPSC